MSESVTIQHKLEENAESTPRQGDLSPFSSSITVCLLCWFARVPFPVCHFSSSFLRCRCCTPRISFLARGHRTHRGVAVPSPRWATIECSLCWQVVSSDSWMIGEQTLVGCRHVAPCLVSSRFLCSRLCRHVAPRLVSSRFLCSRLCIFHST